jgi:ABC-type Fe3+ transport system substrate-binding protein
VDPVNRNIVAHTSSIQVVGYNNKLVSAEKVPNTWEDFLKPDYKGRKFVADIRPTEIAALVPAWGLEKTVDFARTLAAQEPIWVRGGTRTLTAMVAGEYALFIGPNYDSLARAQLKDPAKNLSYKIIEPVPTRLGNADGVLATAGNPYAALLWLEFQATPEGQKISDEHEPFGASIFTQGSVLETLIRGKKLSLVAWDHATKMQEYQQKVVQAYGFPKADARK